MASSEFGTGKSIVVLAIVVGCFAILWPKIFYPMMQAAFSMTSPKTDGDEQTFRPRDRPPHLQPGMMDPNMKKKENYPNPMKEGRPFPHPSSRQPVKPQAKTGGAMSIIMPVYTIGIVVFFVYTVMKLLFKKNPEEKKPLVKDFHMDPDYHKFVCQQPTRESKSEKPKSKPQENPVTPPSKPKQEEQTGNLDDKDYEIYKLRKKLEETEIAMERIMKQMGAVSNCLSKACLLKDGTFTFKESKDAVEASQLFAATPDMVKAVAEDCEGNKEVETEVERVPMVDSEPLATSESVKKENDENDDLHEDDDDNDLDCPVEKSIPSLEQSLKRESSINSDNSSFEMLSHSLAESSSGYGIATLDSENAEASAGDIKSAYTDNLDAGNETSSDDNIQDDDDTGGVERHEVCCVSDKNQGKSIDQKCVKSSS